MSVIKAMFPAGLLTWIVCLVIGSNGSRGGYLNIHRIVIEGYTIHWSWPLFLVGMAISWFVIISTD